MCPANDGVGVSLREIGTVMLRAVTDTASIEFAYRGRTIRVSKNANWPKDKLWIDVNGQRDYLDRLSEG